MLIVIGPINLLDKKNISYEEIRVDLDRAKLKEMMEFESAPNHSPNIINDQAIGGFDDLSALDQAGKLNELLK